MAVPASAPGDLYVMAASFARALKAENKSAKTLEVYGSAIERLGEWLEEQGHSVDIADISPDDVRGFISHLLDTRSDATAQNRYRALNRFFNWCVDEGELDRSPMEKMKPPSIQERPPPVLTVEQLDALLKTTEGTGFEERRDRAIFMLLMDTGMRRSEIATLSVNDLDLDTETVRVLGKGNRVRVVSFGNKTLQALDRYLRARARHKYADSDRLWLGRAGPLTSGGGIKLIVRRRAAQAGLDGIHPHLFRHTFAHMWLDEGGNESDLMELAGWQSPAMLQRYGKSAAAARARRAQKRLSPVDRL